MGIEDLELDDIRAELDAIFATPERQSGDFTYSDLEGLYPKLSYEQLRTRARQMLKAGRIERIEGYKENGKSVALFRIVKK